MWETVSAKVNLIVIKGNEQALGDYGFELDKSPKAQSAKALAKKAAKANEGNS